MKNPRLLLLIAACLAAGSVTANEDVQPKTEPAQQGAHLDNGRCPPETGSRLSKRPDSLGRCIPDGALRTFDNEALLMTGQPGDNARALQLLDPSITRGP